MRVSSIEARERIAEAAERLLRQRAYRDLSVDMVMAEARLSRTIFYRHFETLAGVVGAPLEEIEADLFPVLESDATLADMLGAAVDTYVRHGPFLRAVQAATFYDPSIERTYRDLFERFNEGITALLQAGMDEGRVARGDAAELARAMNLFNNAYLLDTLGRDPSFDPSVALATLLAVWEPLSGG